MNVLNLLASQQADNRADYVRKRQRQQVQPQTVTGRNLGYNADLGKAVVDVDGSQITANVATSGSRSDGQAVQLTFSRNGNWLDSMPTS